MDGVIGNPGATPWTTWLMLGIIVFLVVVILIRDKGIRGGLKRIFTRIGRKIREAKIKMRINREKEKLTGLMGQLGEAAWGAELDVAGAAEIVSELGETDREHHRLSGEIEALEARQEAERVTFENFKEEQEGKIKEQERLKVPLEEEVGRLRKETAELEKTIAEKKRAVIKHEKKIAGHQKHIEDIRGDEDLSDIEKEEKVTGLSGEIRDLDSENRRLAAELAGHEAVRGEPGQRIAVLEPQILDHGRQIEALKEELKNRRKGYEESKRDGLKKVGQLKGRRSELQRRRGELLVGLGEHADRGRLPDERLSGIYSEIDGLKKVLGDLEGRLRQGPPALE